MDPAPSKRPRRACTLTSGSSSSSENNAAAAAASLLGALLRDGERVVVVTGAGVSAASGIPPFRGSADAVWSKAVVETGTTRAFAADPEAWYGEFWFTSVGAWSSTTVRPNAAHEALATLARKFPSSVRIVTQNVDGLHRVSGVPSEQLVEAHGVVGEFRCLSSSPTRGPKEDCEYRHHKTVSCPEATSVATVPRCPTCGTLMAPLALLFDEAYEDHDRFEFDRVREWLRTARALVFVGTSFAVTLTDVALREARDRSVPVVNFNTHAGSLPRAWLLSLPRVVSVVGPCEETLRELLVHL